MLMLAIDPGDTFCGWALFLDGVCERVGTYQPEGLLDWVSDIGFELNILVIEEYRLYPDKAAAQAYSSFPTVETIGALKFIARQHDIRIVMQPAAAKRPARGISAAKKIRMLSSERGQSIHAKDAELHGVYWTIKEHERRKNR